MRNISPGSIFFFIFLFIAFSNLFGGGGFIFPLLIFFFIANGISRAKNQEKKRGHVRESTRQRRSAARDQQRRRSSRTTSYPRTRTANRPSRPAIPKKNPFKKSGKDKFKDFDYDGAIEDFTKALQIDNNDPAIHFNLACAYSLTEEKDKAFESLSKAFALGFNDKERVKTHDALAFLRVQEEFDQFVAGNYKWPLSGAPAPSANVENSELLQQLKQLADLREKGLLTDDEFLMQKKKLLR